MQPDQFLPLLFLVAGGLSLRNYARLSVEGRGLLMTLRALATGILLVVLLAPAWVQKSRESLRPRLSVLLDRSLSMAEEDTAKGSRFSRAEAGIETIRTRYGKAFELEVFEFDSEVKERRPPSTPEGQATDLSAALREATRRQDSRRRAYFLLSDGRSTRGGGAFLWARSLPVPLIALGFGRVGDQDFEARVTRASLPEEAFRGGEVELEAEIEREGTPSEKPLRVRLLVGDETVATQSLASTPGTTLVKFRFLPEDPGLKRIQVRIEDPLAEDSKSELQPKRILETSLRVREDATRILALQGIPSADLGSFLRVLRQDPRFKVRLRSGYGPERPAELPSARESFSPEKVPLVLLGGFSKDMLRAEDLTRLVEAVKQRETSLLLVGNGPEEWKALFESPLADALPVSVPDQQVPLDKRFSVDSTKVHVSSVTRLLTHPQANRQAWKRFPPLAPALALRLAPGARNLLQVPYYPKPISLLAVRSVGRGQVLALNTREVFLWGLFSQSIDKEDLYARFVAGLLDWSADPSRSGAEALELPKLRYRPNESFQIHWQGPEGVEAPATLEVEDIENPGAGVTPLRLEANGPGRASARWRAPAPGLYRARVPGRGVDAVEFAVHPEREEILDTTPDFASLRRMAEAAQGAFLDWTEEADLDRLPPLDASPILRTQERGIYWLDLPQVLGLILFLFCLEWWLRRRRNLV